MTYILTYLLTNTKKTHKKSFVNFETEAEAERAMTDINNHYEHDT